MNSIINNNLRINNLNHRKLSKEKPKRILKKAKHFALVTIVAKGNKHRKSIPNGYIQIYTTEQVGKNDTLKSIAEKYYNEDIYPYYYHSLDSYIEEIAQTNKINKNNITPFQDLIIPVITSQNNIYLERIKMLQKQMKKLTVWVPYQIQSGDTISSLAYKGAGDNDEVYDIVKIIIQYNNISNTNIEIGNTIYIINPQIGDLKKEIFQLKRSLNDFLKTNDNNLAKIY